MGHGPLVVELLTRAHRLGFVLEYRPRAPEGNRKIAIVDAPPDRGPEQRQLEQDIARYEPDFVEILDRPCAVRSCPGPTHVREYGTDLPWCARHGGVRGLHLLHEERPDLFPDPTDYLARPHLQEDAA